MPRAPVRSVAALLLLLISTSWSCSEPEEERGATCPVGAKTTTLTDIHYPDGTCASTVLVAEARLTSAFYRKACRQLAPSLPLPPNVIAATVVRCQPASSREGFGGGVVAQIEVCCP